MFLAKRLFPIGCRNISRLFSTTLLPTKQKQSFFLEPLIGRSILRLKGEMVKQFVQDLITNDINHLDIQQQQSIYAMFLNKNGRILYDTIVYRTPMDENTLFVECDQRAIDDLRKHLLLFRVRKKIDIDILDDLKIWVAFNESADSIKNTDEKILIAENNVIGCQDPRLKDLGMRLIAPQVNDIKNAYSYCNFIESKNGNKYKNLRYRLGIAEGIMELPVGKCFPLESNCDYLHGVSFHKGCYLGQEFTARTYHTGVIRKRIMPFAILNGTIDTCSQDIETINGESLGKLRAFDGDRGIALLKVELALRQTSPFVISGGAINVLGKTERPFWWSVEAPSVQSLKDKTG